ncbi:MAG: hypothetical protein HY898_10000 [Deltaproteobacteria bacterium]|nr:hypothetical protein [Deltaproteobacteria bacterium]
MTHRSLTIIGLLVVGLGVSCGSSDAGEAPLTPAQDASTEAGGAAGAAGAAGNAGVAGAAASAGQAGATGCPASLPAAVAFDNNGSQSWLQIQGDPPGSDIGTFDPSVRKAIDGTIVMSYSSVNLARNKIHTRIAVSTDGVTFTYAASANSAQENVDVPADNDPDCPAGTCKGANIDHETSALLEDPGDPDTSARWKVFTHSYVILKNPQDPNTPVLRYAYGDISVATAPAPSGPWSAPSPAIGWKSASPISSKAQTLLSDLDGMQDCVAGSEPSAAIDPATGALELAFGCVFMDKGVASIRVELVRSTDHGKTWALAHRLLEASDSVCLGETEPQMNAAHLFDRGGSRYLIATPAGPVTFPGGGKGAAYRGCFVFRRTDNGIERDGAGAPIVYGRIDPGAGVFSGACSDIPNGGYVVSALSDTAPSLFRMYGPVAKELP